MGITPKQEKYVRGLVSGMSQREAYASAYNCSKMKPETVDSHASRLLASDKVRARYEELTAELAERVLWDRERAAKELLEVRDIALRHIRQTQENAAHYDMSGKRDIADLPKTAVQLLVASTAELNKMFRVYDAPDSGDGKVTIIDDL